MKSLFRSAAVLTIIIAIALGFATATAAQETESVAANVILCSDPDCADTVNLQTMAGATVSSYAADGTLVDSCTVTITQSGMSDCRLVPAPEGGFYEVTPVDANAGYVLLSDQPEIFESEMHGPIYVWYFAPPIEDAAPAPTSPSTTAYANVVVCTDPACADGTNTSSMGGATITSLDAAGNVIDACEVITYPSGMDGCDITKHAGDGSYQVTPTADYADYTLLSTEPVVLESVSHGTQLLWFYAPPASQDAPAPIPTSGITPVTGLPSTGVGTAASGIVPSAYVVVPFVLAAAGLLIGRLRRH